MENILILPGDGIGPEVMGEVARIIDWFGTHKSLDVSIDHDLVGGCAYDAHGAAISDAAMEKALAADAVLLGAVGGPQWDTVAYAARPERACCGCVRIWNCLRICARRFVFRHWLRLPPSANWSKGWTLIVRELTGGFISVNRAA